MATMKKISSRFIPTTINEFRDFFEKSKRKPYLTIVISIPSIFWPPLLSVQQQLKDVDPDHLYYPPQIFHLTLKELGWLYETINSSTLNWVYNQLENICSKFKPFDIEIKGLSYFPDAVFCEIQNQDQIRELHLKIRENLKEKILPVEFEGDKFVAHVSLLYFVSKNVQKLLNKVNQLSDTHIGKMRVDSICIAYGYPHLLLDPSEEKRTESLLYVREFKLGG